MSSKRKILLLVLVLVIIAAMVIVNINRKSSKAMEVTTEKVKRGDITQVVSGSGKVQPEVDVRISARISAEIIKLPVKEGDIVKKGQLLAELDRQRYEAAVQQYRSSLKSSEASRIKSESDFRRIKDLYDKNLNSQAELDAARAQLLLAEANVEQAQAALSQAEDDLNKTILRTPIDGIVTQLNKEEGEIALGSQFQAEVIMTVADLNRMEVVAEIDENDVVLVDYGDQVKIEVDAIPDTHFVGTVTEIAHTASTRGMGTQEEVTNFEVRVAVVSDVSKLRPGMSATVDIQTETHVNVLNVPIQAITVRDLTKSQESVEKGKKPGQKKSIADDNSTAGDQQSKIGTGTTKAKKENQEVVFVVEGETVKMIPVKTGISSDTDIEVTEGLTDSAMVVTGSFKALSTLLRDGMRVKVRAAGLSEKKQKE